MRIDVEMESLQRYFYYQMRQKKNLEINPKDWLREQGLETAWLDSSSSTECSGDRKRVVGKRDERAEFLCEMADRHLSTKSGTTNNG